MIGFFKNDSIDDTSSLNNYNKATTPKKFRVIGDSITVMGNFVPKLKSKFNAEVVADSFPGSHASMGLTTVADEYYAYITGENALTNSNNMTGSGWAANTGITVENNKVMGDCCVWNKVTRVSSGGDSIIVGTNSTIPTGYTGLAYQFEIIPVDTTKLDIWFVKYVSGNPEAGTEKKLSLNNLVSNRKYKVIGFFDKTKLQKWLTGTVTFTSGNSNKTVTGVNTKFTTELSANQYIKLSTDNSDTVWAQIATVDSDTQVTLTSGYTGTIGGSGAIAYRRQWTDGDSIKMKVFPGGQTANNSVTYFRNWNISWKSPNGVENYTQTTSSAAAGSTAALTKLEMNENQFDTTIILFGRNEAQKNIVSNEYPYIAPRSYYKTMDKLTAQCKKFSNQVLPLNCPPKKDSVLDTWDAADPYLTVGLNDTFNSLKEKHNSGINVWENFKATGVAPSILMNADGLHESDIGGDSIMNMIYNEVGSNRVIANHALSELSGTVKHYLGGTNTGSSWILKTEDINSTDWITNSTSYTSYLINPLGWLRDVAWVGSTSGDKITFSGVNGKQVHVIFRIGDGLGTFYIKLNPGTAKEISYGVNTNYSGMVNQIRGHYVFDNIPAGDNVVEISVNTGEVHICGITVC